jgi:hypothetical protein
VTIEGLRVKLPVMSSLQSNNELVPPSPRHNAELPPHDAEGKKLPAEAEPQFPALAKPQLTAEEQMAMYEEDLKENDWGHQPC